MCLCDSVRLILTPQVCDMHRMQGWTPSVVTIMCIMVSIMQCCNLYIDNKTLLRI
uniref:Uncharacterized protein n=1 Tax=Nelumbo nucifera TaxID=4432 RepID=A0A822Y2Y6_NELNU|nr:TPA_asm: hypothetical protein HUJ06_028090 [Nelumbo nucifera]